MNEALGGTARVLEEHPQSALEGLLRGRADVIRRSPDHVIQDYKTGSIREADGTLKKAFRTQLLLYAYLENEESGSWPKRGEIIPLHGDAVGIDIVPSEAIAAVEEAIMSLDRYNAVVASGLSDSDAAPSALTCRWCGFKLRCPAFWRAVDLNWACFCVLAVAGIVTDKATYGFGTLDIDVSILAGTCAREEARLHGLPLHQFRALAATKIGNVVAASGLATLQSSSAFGSTPWTQAASADVMWMDE